MDIFKIQKLFSSHFPSSVSGRNSFSSHSHL